MKNCYEDGGLVQGQAKFEGNSPENDTVHAKLSPGEIVIDRETISKGPEAILDFVLDQLKYPHKDSKNHLWDGGQAVNPKQAELAEYFGAKPAAAPSSGQNIVKPEDEEFRQLTTAYSNLGPARMSPKMLDRLRILNAQRQYQAQPVQQAPIGYAEGGTVQGFDPDKYLAQKSASAEFDPNKYLEQKTGKKETSFGDKAQTALENYGQAMTLGYLPQIQAATEPISAKIFNAVTGENVEADPYLQARDANIARMEKQSAENPKSALAGTAAGIIGSAIVAPELPILKGAGALKNIGRGAIMGAGYGLAQNPGDVQGEVSPLQVGERLNNAKTGAALGAAVGGAGALIDKGAKALKGSAEVARETANTQAVKAAGGMLKDMRVLNANDKIDEIGKFALDKGIVKAGDTVHDVAEKSDTVREAAGKQLDDIYKAAQEAVKNQRSKIAQQVELSPGPEFISKTYEPSTNLDLVQFPNRKKGQFGINLIEKKALNEHFDKQLGEFGTQTEMIPVGKSSIEMPIMPGFNPSMEKDKILSSVSSKLGDSPDKKTALRTAKSYLDQLIETHGNSSLDPKTANNIKTELDKQINYSRNPLTKDPAKEQAFTAMRSYINDAVKNHIEMLGKESGNPDLAKQLLAANKEYGFAKQLQTMAEDRVSRETANRMFGLTDTIAGAAGAGAGSIIGAASGHGAEGGLALGLLSAGANKLARTAGPGALASAADKAAPILEKTAVPLGKLLEKAPKEVLQKATIMEAASLSKAGPKKWSNDGYSVLFKHVDRDEKEYLRSMKDKLLSSPKGQRLLIEASALKPGSKKLDKVLADIKELQK
jgi:hypothetical protein